MFFDFVQNNSGGKFRRDDKVTDYVIIEAANADRANSIAEDIGIYFDGVTEGFDCSCCGDRWSRAYGKGDANPLIYGEVPNKAYVHHNNGVYCRVFYADGLIKEYRNDSQIHLKISVDK